ncbi:MAG: hypothetical protein K1060chlam4_00170 [Candidatus Anoxychlamydiales bacterium]|nr:hypothetical protein [Candidatus Anoxychlamydiales bacterium]
MNPLKKILVIAFTMIITTNIFAKEKEKSNDQSQEVANCDPCVNETKSEFDRGYPICEDTFKKGYNAAGRIDVCGKIDTFVTASFIYWEVLSDQIDLGVLESNTNSNDRNIQILDFKEEYEPGFKVGLGTHFKHDNWDVFAEYTRLHGSETTSVDINLQDTNSDFRGFWLIDHLLEASAERFTSPILSRWKMHLDKIDLEIARSYYIGTNLIFRPFIGGSAHWLDQNYRQNYDFVTIIGLPVSIANNLSLKNDSWAIGPKFGLNMNWFFFKNFRLFGRGSIDIMFAQNKISGSHVVTATGALAPLNPSLNPTLTGYKKYILRDVEDFSIGLGWGSYFKSDKGHFDLAVSYEIQRYSHTNYMSTYDQTFGSTQFQDFTKQVKPGDLFLHGLSVTTRFDF